MKVTSHREPQPTIITLEFEKPFEIVDLLQELRQWKPSEGWSQQALELFQGLEEATRAH